MKKIKIYISFILILTIFFISIYMLKKRDQIKVKHINLLLSSVLGPELTPENIWTIPYYHLNDNLWGRLLTKKRKSSLAGRFYIEKDLKNYFFTVDQDAKFSDGSPVTADDVIFSLNRLKKRKTTGHYSPGKFIKKIEKVKANGVKITLSYPSKAFLLLSSFPEFGILSPRNCDKKEDVINRKLTSGAYSLVSRDVKRGKVKLKKNPHFFLHNRDSPDLVDIQFHFDIKKTREAILNEKFDFIEVYFSDAESLIDFIKNKPRWTYKMTNPSISNFLITNPKKLTLKQRQYLAWVFDSQFTYSSKYGLEVRSYQMLPSGTIGHVLREDIALKPFRKGDVKFPKPLVLRSVGKGKLRNQVVNILKMNGVDVEVQGIESKNYHIALTGQGMNLEYPEVEFYLSILSPYAWIKASEKTKATLKKTLTEQDDFKRAEAFKTIQKNLISTGIVIPLTVQGYLHIYKKDKIDVSSVLDYDGDIPIHQFKVLR